MIYSILFCKKYFRKCSFHACSFYKASVFECNFSESSLLRSNFSKSEVRDTVLSGADLSETDAGWSEISQSDLRLCNSSEMKLKGALIINSKMYNIKKSSLHIHNTVEEQFVTKFIDIDMSPQGDKSNMLQGDDVINLISNIRPV